MLITGGGTGGHCTPALAVAEALSQLDPQGKVTYVGRADGPESRLVPAAGLEFIGLSLGSMGSSRMTATPRLLTRMPLAYLQARQVMADFDPDVVLATGGYVSVPVAMVARRRGVLVVLLEQNRLPGRGRPPPSAPAGDPQDLSGGLSAAEARRRAAVAATPPAPGSDGAPPGNRP